MINKANFSAWLLFINIVALSTPAKVLAFSYFMPLSYFSLDLLYEYNNITFLILQYFLLNLSNKSIILFIFLFNLYFTNIKKQHLF